MARKNPGITADTLKTLGKHGITQAHIDTLLAHGFDTNSALAVLFEAADTIGSWKPVKPSGGVPASKADWAVDTLLTLRQHGWGPQKIRNVLNDDTITSITDLLTLGLTPSQVDKLVGFVWLEYVVPCVKAGVTFKQLTLLESDHEWEDIEPETLAWALKNGLSLDVLSKLETDGESLQALINILGAYEGKPRKGMVTEHLSWDDVNWLLSKRLPISNIEYTDAAFEALTDAGLSKSVLTSERCRLLVALNDLSSPGLDELLPLAIALEGKPWLDTMLAMLADDAHGEGELTLARAIALARRLDMDPTLPKGETLTERAWSRPEILTPLTRRSIERLDDLEPHERPIISQARKNGVEFKHIKPWLAVGLNAHDACDAAAWIGPGFSQWDTPRRVSDGPWSMTGAEALAGALRQGASIETIRDLSTVFGPTDQLGPYGAALMLACGVDATTARQWVRKGVHGPTAAIMTAYGLAPNVAVTHAKTSEQARTVLTVMAAGGTADDLDTVVSIVDADEFGDSDAGPTVTAPIELLRLLAKHQTKLSTVTDYDYQENWTDVLAGGGLPLSAIDLALGLARKMHDPRNGGPDGQAIIALATAVCGDAQAMTALERLAMPANTRRETRIVRAATTLLEVQTAEHALRAISVTPRASGRDAVRAASRAASR